MRGAVTADPRGLAEVSIDLSIEELVILCEGLGSPLPASMGRDADTLDPAARQLVTRALVARRLLVTDPEAALHTSVQRLLELVVAPSLYVEVSRRTPSGTDVWFVTAIPEAAVEQYEVGPGIYRFTPFDTAEVPVRLLDRAGLVERAGTDDLEAFTLNPADLVAAFAAVEAGDQTAAGAALAAAGVAEEVAAAFVNAAVSRVATAAVTVIHRTSATTVEGGRLCWLDGGDGAGLWLLPPPESLDAPDPGTAVGVARTTSRALLAEVASLLPAQSSG